MGCRLRNPAGGLRVALFNVGAARTAAQVLYRVQKPEAFAGQHLVIAGSGDSALDWANHLAGLPPQAIR